MRGRVSAAVFLLLIPILPYALKTGGAALLGEGPGAAVVTAQHQAAVSYRTELLMGLDLLVRAERAIRTDAQSFTRALGRVPDVLGPITQLYRVQVVRATRDRLLIVASGEGGRGLAADSALVTGDRVAIDESFRVRANFPLPAPPRDYLRLLARTVLARIQATETRLPTREEQNLWEGVFRGYFRYERRSLSQGGTAAVAVGLAPPVQGDIVDAAPGADLFDWVYQQRNTAWLDRELRGGLEKIYLAERIHQEHLGSYAPALSGLYSKWNGLSALGTEESPLVLQDLQLDTTFGFQAEIARRHPVEGGDSQAGPESRVWAVNGYGQVSEVSPIEAVIERLGEKLEQGRKSHSRPGEVRRPGSVDGQPEESDVPNASRPLLIDRVE